MKKEKVVHTDNYEIQGLSSWRLFAHWVRAQSVLVGGAGQAPVLRQVAVLYVLHQFGKPLYNLRSRARHNELARKILHLVRKYKP